MTDQTPRATSGEIHRLLDDAFAGVEITPDTQDLKEEVRANLVARVAELEDAGRPPAEAARRAITELGDVRELVDPSPTNGRPAPTGWEAEALRHRVRPEPAFVVGIVVASLAALVGLLLAALGAADVLPLPAGVLLTLLGIGSTGVAWIVGDTLAHETTTNHPMPAPRAGGYFLASLLAVYGLGVGGLVALDALPTWAIALAALGVVAAVVLFAFLGATQTNRRKAWARELLRQQPPARSRFEEEPETAARFGIYTAVIWLVSFAGFVVLGLTTGWAWSWLALLAGFVAMMVTLARMLFRAR